MLHFSHARLQQPSTSDGRAASRKESEAIIRNANDSSLNIYCPSGQVETVPGMFIESAKVKPKVGEQIIVQMTVDGKNHPFYLQETQFQAHGRVNTCRSIVS